MVKAEESELSDLLNQEVIRIFIFDGNGMGHQSNSFLLGRWLRDQGFSGELQFVYKDEKIWNPGPREITNSEKIQKLYPSFDSNGPDDQFIAEDNVRVLKLAHDPDDISVPKVKYMLTGGIDRKANYENFLSQVGMDGFYDVFIAINPWRWQGIVSYFQMSDTNITFELNKDTSDSYFSEAYGRLIEIPDYQYPSVVARENVVEDMLLDMVEKNWVVTPFYGNLYSSYMAIQYLSNYFDRKFGMPWVRPQEKPTIVVPIFLPIKDRDDFMLDLSDEARERFRDPGDIIEKDINFVLVDSVAPGEFESIFTSNKFPLVFVSGQNSVNLMAASGQNFLQIQEVINVDPYMEEAGSDDELAKLRKNASDSINKRPRSEYSWKDKDFEVFMAKIIDEPEVYQEWSRLRSIEIVKGQGAFEYILKGLVPQLRGVNSCGVVFGISL